MFKLKMTSIKVSAWMDKEDFKSFVNDNLLSIFIHDKIILTMYNGFIIGCTKYELEKKN